MQSFYQHEWNESIADDCRQLVRLAAKEDLDRGQDWTTLALVPAEAVAVAHLVARKSGTVTGMRAAQVVVEQMDSRIALATHCEDGSTVEPNTRLATLKGPARSLLTVERPLLNFVGHLSGISSLAGLYVKEVSGTKAQVYDTRKTLPGWRRLEKYAVRCGGGNNHRTGLFDAVLIKDNHLAFFGGHCVEDNSPLASAVVAARDFLRKTFPSATDIPCVEIEVDTVSQFQEVIKATPDIVLLDNMSLSDLTQCVALRDQLSPKIVLEASGGVNLKTIRQIALTGVDRISVGALTHSAEWFDVGLDWAMANDQPK